LENPFAEYITATFVIARAIFTNVALCHVSAVTYLMLWDIVISIVFILVKVFVFQLDRPICYFWCYLSCCFPDLSAQFRSIYGFCIDYVSGWDRAVW